MVHDLATIREPVPGSLLCSQVDDLFRADDASRSLLVRRADGDLMLINRTFFYQILVGRKGFGWALHHNKPVESLNPPEPVRLAADRQAVEAGIDLLVAGVAADDDVLVVGGTDHVAILAVSALFAEVARHSARADRFRALLQNLSDVVVVLDACGRLRYLSPSYERITGRPSAERIGEDAFALAHPDDQPILRALIQRSLVTPGAPLPGEFRMTIADGTWRRFEMMCTNMIEDPNIGGIVLNYRDVTDRRLLEDQLRHQTLHDPLTGLPNRTLLLERIDHALARAGRTADVLAVLYVDLDGFKAVNDTCGHAAGNDLLTDVAKRIAAQVRPGDTVARIGGDEFAVALEALGDASEAAALAARLHDTLEQPLPTMGRKVLVQASIGVAIASESEVTGEDLIRRADLAMYAAKSLGKNRTVHWEPALEQHLLADLELAAELQGAIAGNQMLLHYQPIVSMKTRDMVGVEALVRWQHPDRGLVPPDRFISLAERTGAIAGLTRWVLGQACSQARRWHDQRPDHPLVVSVNISAADLCRPGMTADVASILERTGLRAELLELEITETALVTNFDAARTASQEFSNAGSVSLSTTSGPATHHSVASTSCRPMSSRSTSASSTAFARATTMT